MKNVIAKATVLIAAGFAVLLGATPAKSETLLSVNIPFAFLAGGQQHGAGAYQVRVNPDFKYVELRPMDGAAAERVLLNGTFVPRFDKKSTDAFLQFEEYGATYTLRAVGRPGAIEGMAIAPSKTEKELVKTNGGSTGAKIVTIR